MKILNRAGVLMKEVAGDHLRGANLRGANLRGANLRGADLEKATGLAQQIVAPPHGEIIGWKKVSGAIIRLLIPADAKRINAYGSRKCRAEFAYVLNVENSRSPLEAYRGFTYPQSGLVTPDKYDPDPRIECSNGIHFFITREEAEEYR